MKYFYDVCPITKDGPRKPVQVVEKLEEARILADEMLKNNDWLAVGVCISGQIRREWSYLNAKEHGPAIDGSHKRKKPPKWAKTPLPMKDNPVAGE